jgi:hypothetical protein
MDPSCMVVSSFCPAKLFSVVYKRLFDHSIHVPTRPVNENGAKKTHRRSAARA